MNAKHPPISKNHLGIVPSYLDTPTPNIQPLIIIQRLKYVTSLVIPGTNNNTTANATDAPTTANDTHCRTSDFGLL